MEIYNADELTKRPIYEYISEKSPIQDGIPPIAISNEKLSIHDIIIVNNKAYRITHILNRVTSDPNNRKWAVAKELPETNTFISDKHSDNGYKDLITCPYCGFENPDSWQFKDIEGFCICPHCKSTFSYKKKITVEYQTKPISKVKVHNL